MNSTAFLRIVMVMSTDDDISELLQRAKDAIVAAESVTSANAQTRARAFELALKVRDIAEDLRRMQEDMAIRP